MAKSNEKSKSYAKKEAAAHALIRKGLKQDERLDKQENRLMGPAKSKSSAVKSKKK